jgi:hypothetical protein
VKKKTTGQPSRVQPTVLRQLVELIPSHLVPKLARKHGVDSRSRTFSPWSHVVALLFAQLAHSLSLNDICDALRVWTTPLRALRGARPPSRNTLSHANKVRDCAMAESLFWSVLEHLQQTFPGFRQGTTRGLAWRFRRSIHVVDSTVIQLVSACVDWARHNRRKAAARVHMRLSLRSLLPGFVVVDSARKSELSRVRQVCAGLCRGEIVLFDKGYHWFSHLWELNTRGVFFVTRAREDLRFKVRKRLKCDDNSPIVADELVVNTGRWTKGDYTGVLRRVRARVQVNGQERELVFLTNNFTWSAASIAELYRCRWQIEAFFKQIKQTLQLADFLGRSANAVTWQVWMALLVYVLLRFIAWRSKWAHSFSRLFTLLRAALWQRGDLTKLLDRHGTADGHFALLQRSCQSYLPGFAT